MKKVIITGATGLIGSHLAAQLLSRGGYQITALIRSEASKAKLREILNRDPENVGDAEGYQRFTTTDLDENGAHSRATPRATPIATQRGDKPIGTLDFLKIDTDDYEQICAAIADFDVVFHCAAIVDFDSASSEMIVANNVRLTHFIVESCIASDRNPLLVHVSSIAALGTVSYPELTTEETPFSNIATASGYSRSKFLSENELWRGAKLGLKVVVVSPSIVLGAAAKGSQGLQPVFKMAARGIPLYTDGITGFVDVDDVARAMIELSIHPAAWGQRYLLSGHNVPFRKLIEQLNAAFGHRQPRIKVSKRWLSFWVSLLSIVQRKPLITRDMQGFLTNQTAYDGSKIERAIDFRYTPFDQTTARVPAQFRDS